MSVKTAIASALCLACVSMTAFAASEITPDKDGKYSVSYADGVKDEYYSIVVVKGTYTESQTPTISEDTILHIDQTTAGTDGAKFTSFVPKSDESATVYIGGSNLDSPVLFGYLGEETETTSYKVSIGVTKATSKSASVSLTSASSENVYNAVLNTQTGKYEVTVPQGTYKVVVTAPGHLSHTVNALAVSADTEKSVTVLGGDADGNGTINFDDLVSILNNYGQQNDTGDVDGNGTVNFDDIVTVLNNYGAKATVE